MTRKRRNLDSGQADFASVIERKSESVEDLADGAAGASPPQACRSSVKG